MRTFPLVALTLAASLAVSACGGGGSEVVAPPETVPVSATSTPRTTTTVAEPVTSALTGLEVDESVVERPIVAVKYDNFHGKSTPQAGVNAADVVYEVTVEGQVTRFLALFQSADAGPIGPIRSARGSEIGLLEELHRPLFTWHGANALLRRQVRSSDIVPRSIDDVPDLFYRDRSRPAPYNSFALGTAQIRETAPDDASGPTDPILAFTDDVSEPPSPSAVPATSVSVQFPPAFSSGGGPGGVPVRFDWDGQRWARFQNGRPHVDADGEQIAVENVIVRFTDAVDSGTRDQAGSVVPTAVVTGEGEAWVFSRGSVTVGRWSKPDNASRTSYTDQAGNEILLTPGQTWIALPYTGGRSSYE